MVITRPRFQALDIRKCVVRRPIFRSLPSSGGFRGPWGGGGGGGRVSAVMGRFGGSAGRVPPAVFTGGLCAGVVSAVWTDSGDGGVAVRLAEFLRVEDFHVFAVEAEIGDVGREGRSG